MNDDDDIFRKGHTNYLAERFLLATKYLQREPTENLAAFVILPDGKKFQYASEPPGMTEVLRRYGYEKKDDNIVPMDKLQDAAKLNFSGMSSDQLKLVENRCLDALSDVKDEINGRLTD